MSAWSSTRRTRTELFKGTPNRPDGAFAWSPASDEPIANDMGVYHISFRVAMSKPAMSLGDVALASHDKSSSPLRIFFVRTSTGTRRRIFPLRSPRDRRQFDGNEEVRLLCPAHLENLALRNVSVIWMALLAQEGHRCSSRGLLSVFERCVMLHRLRNTFLIADCDSIRWHHRIMRLLGFSRIVPGQC